MANLMFGCIRTSGEARGWMRYPLAVVADRGEVFPDDPGRGTPAMVYHLNQTPDGYEVLHDATLACAIGEAEMEGVCGVKYWYCLTQPQVDWLVDVSNDVDAYLG